MSGLNRPKGMSQLDYLWTTYGIYDVATNITNIDTPDSIPNADAVKGYVDSKIGDGNINGTGITNIKVISDSSEAIDSNTLYIITSGNTFTIQFGGMQFTCNCTNVQSEQVLLWANETEILYNNNENILWQE